MGVHGLWRLLDSFGQVTTPEEWRGRRVAIDASIWMAQFRSMCAPGEDVDQKILEGFFVRILKLVFYGIRPLFVFDGVASMSKTMEHHRRQKARETLAMAALKRKARQIFVGQVSSGVLDVHQLALKRQDATCADEPATADTKDSSDIEVKLSQDEKKEDVESMVRTETRRKRARHTDTSDPKPHRHHHRHRHSGRHHRRRVVAPEAVSRAVTGAFLEDAELTLQERSTGEQRVLQNALRFTSTSLFMGPRRVVEKTAPHTNLVHDEDLLVSDESIITVATSTTSCDADNAVKVEIEIVTSASSVDSVVSAGGKEMWPAQPRTQREGSVEPISPTPTPVSKASMSRQTWKLRGLSSPSRDRADSDDKFDLTTEGAPCKREPHLAPRQVTENASQEDAAKEQSGAAEDQDNVNDSSSSSLSVWTDSDRSMTSDETESTSSDWASASSEDDLWNPSTQLAPHHVSLPGRVTGSEDGDEDAEFTPVPLPVQLATDHQAAATPTPRPTDTPAAQERRAQMSGWDQRGAAATRRVVPFELLDIVTLLECFGIPFCLSPSEADAQCAYLCESGVVSAVFTEDSDVIVHGGGVVLRGFFSSSKHVVAYRQAELTACGLDKLVLVALALLLGCDYTDGVTGIGLIGALQALTASWTRRIVSVDAKGRTREFQENAEDAQPEFVCALLRRWTELVLHPAVSWETGDPDMSPLQYAVLARHHHEWVSLGINAYEPPLSAAALFYTPEVDRSENAYDFSEPNWLALRSFAASRGLLGSTWVVQRLELAQKEHAKQMALSQQEDANQRRLTEFGVKKQVREAWAYKKLSPRFAQILENLREMRQKP